MHLHKPSWLSSLGLIALLQYAPAVFANVKPGVPVKSGTELRILPLGDSITWGYNSPDGNGYRLELYNNLAGDKVVMAGAVQSGNMIDNWNAGYPGQTIQYIIGQAANSYSQTPNIVLFMAGTNDMNPDPNVSKQGTDATQATQRLSNAVDQLFKALP
ncbi:SGNH/GDSL hydrolase family protein, partial [Salmonella enterica]|uniref:SGNH/GDSL hydrolase family protein n=1 Tax=Salmonella enterica TaxID=28901 RepID=UPI001FD74FD4